MKIINTATFKRLIREQDFKTARESTLVKDYNTQPEVVDDRVVRFAISDESVDRHGDVIKLSAWDLSNYKRNPVVLWNHDDNYPPLGRCIDIKQENGQLKAVVEFVSRSMPVVGETAEMALRMCREGFLNATSVGFVARDWTEVNDKNRGDAFNPGVDFTNVDFLEFSIVPLPANPNALMIRNNVEPFSKRAVKPKLLRQIEILRLT